MRHIFQHVIEKVDGEVVRTSSRKQTQEVLNKPKELAKDRAKEMATMMVREKNVEEKAQEMAREQIVEERTKEMAKEKNVKERVEK